MPMHDPPHPGAVLKDILVNRPMTVGEFAKHLGVSRNTLSRILNERSGVTADVSIRLSQAFGQPSADIWFQMQAAYDFWQAEHKKKRTTVARLPKAA